MWDSDSPEYGNAAYAKIGGKPFLTTQQDGRKDNQRTNK